MSKVRTLTLCLTAALAFAAFGGASAAYAKEKLPAWGTCDSVETHEGHYGDPNCVVPAKKVFGNYNGGYEWYPLVEGEGGGVGAELGRGGLEQSPVTIAFHDAYQITCSGGLSEETLGFPLWSARATTAPDFAFAGCFDSEGGSCFSAGAGDENEIENEPEYRKGKRDEPGSWVGEPKFISGKTGPNPAVGEVYKTEEKRGVFYEQIVCEGTVHAFTIGGETKGEELTAQITPVNAMTSEITATLSQSGGVQGPAALEGRATKPLYAEVNGSTRETIGIEGALIFTEIPILHQPNHSSPRELELKATP